MESVCRPVGNLRGGLLSTAWLPVLIGRQLYTLGSTGICELKKMRSSPLSCIFVIDICRTDYFSEMMSSKTGSSSQKNFTTLHMCRHKGQPLTHSAQPSLGHNWLWSDANPTKITHHVGQGDTNKPCIERCYLYLELASTKRNIGTGAWSQKTPRGDHGLGGQPERHLWLLS